jgi:Peptidase inhibitor I78 family
LLYVALRLCETGDESNAGNDVARHPSGQRDPLMKARLLLPLSLVLMACVPPEPKPDDPVDPVPLHACGASDLQGLVGQSAKVLDTIRFGQTTRIIRPGMAVTMDFVANRLNIWIAEGDVIARVTCG